MEGDDGPGPFWVLLHRFAKVPVERVELGNDAFFEQALNRGLDNALISNESKGRQVPSESSWMPRQYERTLRASSGSS